MKSCWEILHISVTSDQERIKQAYRDLVKKYHPDTVQVPEKIRKYTIHCAKINEAYNEAIKFAKSQPYFDSQRTSQYPKEGEKSWYFEYGLNFIGFSIFILFLIGIYTIIAFIPDKINSLPDTHIIKIIFLVLLIVFVGGIIVGGCVLGLLDMFLVFVIDGVISNLGLDKYVSKIKWLLILVFNIYILYFTSFGDTLLDKDDQMAQLYNAIWRIVVSSTVPLILLISWLQDILAYRKLKRQKFSIQDLMF
ncbi:MAG: J domain-containing protein [Fibrobacteria bacterium]|nr:J domain-containing protein [Fibrobacteria bacterium]